MNQQGIYQLVSRLISSTTFIQVYPFLAFFVIPAVFLWLASYRHTFIRPLSMVLEILSSALPWNWSSSHLSSKPVSDRQRNKSSKRLVRTRTQQLLANDEAGSSREEWEGGNYPGIVNISGTYCFMDSTLQAMASLSYLQPHIDEIHAKAEEFDVPTPVVDALRNILHTLNTPSPSHHSIRPVEMINALAHYSKSRNSLFSSREHQDAQELFQLVSEAIKSEAGAVYKEGLRDRGLGGFAAPQVNGTSNSVATSGVKDLDINKGVFDGLTANRRSCMQCGYTEAVMHFAFDNWQLTVPRQAVCNLEECLADYTRIEVLTDCICRKCSIVATLAHLQEEADKLTEVTSSDPEPSLSKKKRARDARKLVTRVKAALDEGRIEEDIRGVKLEKVFSKASTKQAMIARPPPVLALHLNRSMHFGHYASKNTCRVMFPDILDLTPYTTSGKLSTSPSSPISQPPPLPPFHRSTTPTPATYTTPRTLYRLSSVVVHYGQHSFGHYVCYRRKPRPPSYGAKRFAPPKMQCPFGCDCKQCERYGPVREDNNKPSPGSQRGTGEGWLRISDDDVRECGIEGVEQEGSGAFMLYYERVTVYQSDVYGNGVTEARSSEDTLKAPAANTANGSTYSLAVSVIEAAAKAEEEREREKATASVSLSSSPPRVFGPRIVRSVSATPSQRLGSSRSPARTLPTQAEGQEIGEGEQPSPKQNGVANGHIPHGPSAIGIKAQSLDNVLRQSPQDLHPASVRHSSPSPTRSSIQPVSYATPALASSMSTQSNISASPIVIKSSQPTHPAAHRPTSPPRTVGLRA
ncbi:cysteine proteinase [Trametopsis cervina]|nr:cysteine proteinase [Trametopsis cervina]